MSGFLLKFLYYAEYTFLVLAPKSTSPSLSPTCRETAESHSVPHQIEELKSYLAPKQGVGLTPSSSHKFRDLSISSSATVCEDSSQKDALTSPIFSVLKCPSSPKALNSSKPPTYELKVLTL